MALAVTGAVATPTELVVAVVVTMLAPLAGPLNVTTAPDTRLPTESFTVTTKGLVKAVLIVALCPVPLFAVIVAGTPAPLVMEKVAEVAPVTEAVMV